MVKKWKNIFLIGPMGAGKSTIGRTLAAELNLQFYDTDKEIEARCGANISWIFELEGEMGFRKREELIVEQLTALEGIILATGGGVVLSTANRNFLASRGLVVYLQVSLEQQILRTRRDKNRPLLQTSNLRQTLENLRQQREALYQDIADLTIPTDGYRAPQVAAAIIKQINNNF